MDILLSYELQNLLEEYGRGKQADDKFILKAFEIVLKNKNITKKVENINVSSDAYIFNEPYYSEEEKTIYMKSNIKKEQLIGNYIILNGDSTYVYNLKVLKEILILCNKLSEYKYVSGFVSNLLYLSNEYKLPILKPSDKMARIDATKEITNIASNAYLANKELANNYFKWEALKELLKGYSIKNNKVISPTLYFILKCNEEILANASCYGKKEEEINDYLEKEAMKNSLDNKLYLGLPITTLEYQSVDKLKNETYGKLERTKSLFF